MNGLNVPLARRWFGLLLLVAVLAMGALYWALGSPPSPTAGLVVLTTSVLLTASTVQAVRILRALNGPPRLAPRRVPPTEGHDDPSRRHRRSDVKQ